MEKEATIPQARDTRQGWKNLCVSRLVKIRKGRDLSSPFFSASFFLYAFFFFPLPSCLLLLSPFFVLLASLLHLFRPLSSFPCSISYLLSLLFWILVNTGDIPESLETREGREKRQPSPEPRNTRQDWKNLFASRPVKPYPLLSRHIQIGEIFPWGDMPGPDSVLP